VAKTQHTLHMIVNIGTFTYLYFMDFDFKTSEFCGIC